MTRVQGETSVPAPTAVYVLDVDRPVESLSFTLPGGRPYAAVMLLVRGGRRPRALRVLSLDSSGGVSAAEISAAIAPWLDDGEGPSDRLDASEAPQPLISVVVATCAGGPTLARCVASVLAGDYENVEVIVVDNRPLGSPTADMLAERFPDDPRVRYAPEARVGLSFVRNTGLALARGEIVAFTDDDSVADGGWLGAVADAFTPEVSCVTGLIMPLTIDTPTQALFERFAGLGKGLERRSFRLAGHAGDRLFPYAAGAFGSGANTAMRTSTAARLGGFDVHLGTGTAACGGEDLDMYIRLLLAGETLVYEPAAVLFHEHPAEPRDLRRRAFRYGVGLTAMLAKQALTGPRRRLLGAIPAGVRHLVAPRSRKNASRGTGYPYALRVLELLGMLVGPVAYALSVRRSPAAPEMHRIGVTPAVQRPDHGANVG